MGRDEELDRPRGTGREARSGKPRILWVAPLALVALVASPLFDRADPPAAREPVAVADRLCSTVRDILVDADGEEVPEAPQQLGDAVMRSVPAWQQRYDSGLDLTSAAQGHGRASEASWESSLVRHGFRAGWLREWILGDPNFDPSQLSESVLEFSSPQGATAFQRELHEGICGQADDVFTVPGVPGSVGLRLMLEPDRVTEQVSFVLGARRFIVAWTEPDGIPGRQELFSLARRAYDVAGMPGNICSHIPNVFEHMAVIARSGSSEPIKDLASVLVRDAPLGFDLLSDRPDRIVAGSRTTPQHYRTWRVDGGGTLSQHVTQHASLKQAIAELRTTATNLCHGSDSVEEVEEIRGSLMVTQVRDDLVARYVLFARGSRVFMIDYHGAVAEVPIELLHAFGALADQRAR